MKAWTVIGYTHNGGVYCAECGEDAYAGMPEGEEATAVFASDEVPAEWACMSCDSRLTDHEEGQ